jgi:hypothetical protein
VFLRLHRPALDADTGTTLATRLMDDRPLFSYFDGLHAVADISSNDRPADPSSNSISISQHADWTLNGNCKILWVPVHLRPRRCAFHGAAVAVGYTSGTVYRVGVDLGFLPT